MHMLHMLSRRFLGNLLRHMSELWNVVVSVDPCGLNEVEISLTEGV